MFQCLINSSNSLFVLILQISLASLVGPNIFLNIFLSNTVSFLWDKLTEQYQSERRKLEELTSKIQIEVTNFSQAVSALCNETVRKFEKYKPCAEYI